MLNPVSFTESVISDFLKYQLSTYRFSDPELYAQMRRLLNLDETRSSPLLKGPYVNLSRAFRQGASLEQLAAAGILHPGVAALAPYPRLYAHQEKAIRAIAAGRHAIVATGTGSGKTECFLYPIISRCLELRDEGAAPGVVAVLVYPMNALAEDQRLRLRELLAGSGVSFGMYTGATPDAAEGSLRRLPPGGSQAAYRAELARLRKANPEAVLYPAEERVSRREMRDPATAPRILLTNVKELEFLLTRGTDAGLFAGARLEYLVFDEAHTFTGAIGAETAALIRRLKVYCGTGPDGAVCVATSATIADPERGPDAGRAFAARFFGVEERRVELVGEEYEAEGAIWAESPRESAAPAAPQVLLKTLLAALGRLEGEELDAAAIAELSGACSSLFGRKVAYGPGWRGELYRDMAGLKLPYQLAEKVRYPIALGELRDFLKPLRREPVSEEEILAWFALGAAAREEGRPLFRPVVHNFVRGIEGAQATLDPATGKPTLYLSGEDREHAEDRRHAFPIVVCTTCGQHYFRHQVAGLVPAKEGFGGGHQKGGAQYWESLEGDGGKAVYLFDRIQGEIDDEEDEEAEGGPPRGASGGEIRRSAPLYVCVECGALMDRDFDACPSCGRSATLASVQGVLQRDQEREEFQRCVCCGKRGNNLTGRYREPVRAIKAITAPDIHILAQSMIQNLERKRLLVFADNRQDAAFQAGWMQDHSRRYRFLNLALAEIGRGPTSLGDLVHGLDARFEADKRLSFALLREVWDVAPRGDSPQHHREERKIYIRLQLLRELTRTLRDTQGLEAWGRLRVGYRGLDARASWVRGWAAELGIPPEELASDCELYLDNTRRSSRCLYDKPTELFTRFIDRFTPYVQTNYVPNIDIRPKVLKLERDTGDNRNYVVGLLPRQGQTVFSQLAGKWGVGAERLRGFAEGFWGFLVGSGILVEAQVLGRSERPIAGAAGWQIDVERLVLEKGASSYRCATCHQVHSRPSTGMRCAAWGCSGALLPREDDPEDFDQMMLDREVAILQAEEHSAQVPAKIRERLEREFKDEHLEKPNTLVCTPTLEMGVDIGSLDCILMRNMPPLPANYWQRAGRAGRRFRIAVDVTYARPATFDQAYFKDPLKLLQGMIDPPSFNLRNAKLVEKHVHSAVLSWFRQRAADPSLAAERRRRIADTLAESFPGRTGAYVFSADGRFAASEREFGALAALVAEHRVALLEELGRCFTATWPAGDADSASPERLAAILDAMASELTAVVRKLHERVAWARRELDRINRAFNATAHYDDFDKTIKFRLEGFLMQFRSRGAPKGDSADSEEATALSFLALEGFLPGYGMDSGSILGEYSSSGSARARSLSIRRSPSVALREFAPGNLLYALGSKYVPRRYHLSGKPSLAFDFDPERSSLVEVGRPDGAFAAASSGSIESLELADAEILHFSTISDEEDYRFSMPSQVLGMPMEAHGGGASFRAGSREIRFLKNYQFRLVNIGPGMKYEKAALFGFPICPVCGYSTSPYSSDAEKKKFWERHAESCGQGSPHPYALHVEDAADALLWGGFQELRDAYSLVEAVRKGAAVTLDMEEDDLQLLALPQDGEYSMMLYDPMPGGSGLLEQILAKWETVLREALAIAENCPSRCATACVDCLYSYRNSQYHRFLDRGRAAILVQELMASGPLARAMDIPQKIPQAKGGPGPANPSEARLRSILVKAGLPEPEAQRTIVLGGRETTRPDFYYEAPNPNCLGICIYLDGMGSAIHGDPAQAARDAYLRQELEEQGYMVVVLTYTELGERDSLARKLFKIALALVGKDAATRIRDSEEWHE